jgi:hypothetical protein
MVEKRKCPRWLVESRVKIQLEGAVAPMTCTVHDINFKGAKISLPQKLPPDTFLTLVVTLSGEFSFKAEAWVTWHRTIDGHNVYGLYFTRLRGHDKERIYQFLHRYRPEEVKKKWWVGAQEEEGGGEVMEEDRRIFERLPASIPLRYLDVQSGSEGEARTTDVSAKGIGLVSAGALKPRDTLEMWLKVADRDEPLYTRGEVVWSKAQGAQEYRAGISLERADLLGLSRALRPA